MSTPTPPQYLHLEACTVDLRRDRVLRDGAEVVLTTLEADLLRYVATQPSEPLSVDELLIEVWGYRSGVRSRAVANTVSRLRSKIEVDPANPRHLITIFGKGYRFEPLTEGVERPTEEPRVPGPVRTTNVVRRRTQFVGRACDLETLTSATKTGGITTVLGGGGMGKTRLAVELALALPDRWAGGRWQVDLSKLPPGSEVVHAVARVLGVELPERTRADEALVRVGRALASRGPTLLILDNAEHVLDPVQDALAAWTQHTPEVCWLITSRVRTEIEGERVVDLVGLPTEEAVALLRDRMVSLGVDAHNDAHSHLDAIATILEGRPLSLELAAARARVLLPAELNERLHTSLAVLKDSARDPRHASLWAVLQWSWDLLEPAEQVALAQASLFAGPFSIEAAEVVIEVEDAAGAIDDLELIKGLMDHSVLERVHTEGAPSFRVPTTVRQFVAQTNPDTAGIDARTRYREWFFARGRKLAAQHEQELPGALAAMEPLRDDLLHLAVSDPEFDARAEAILILTPLLARRGPQAQLDMLLDGFDPIPVPVHIRDRLTLARASSLLRRGQPTEAEVLLAGMSADAPAYDSARVRGDVALRQGEIDESEAHYRAALAGLPDGPDTRVAHCLRRLSLLFRRRGDAEEELTMLYSALRNLPPHAALEGGHIHLRLGTRHMTMGEIEPAQEHYGIAIEIAESANHQILTLMVRGQQAFLAGERGDVTEAMRLGRIQIAEAKRLGDAHTQIIILANMALQVLAEDELALSAALLEECQRVPGYTSQPRIQGFCTLTAAVRQHLSGRLDEAASTYRQGIDILRGVDDRTRIRGQVTAVALMADMGSLDEAKEILDECSGVEAHGEFPQTIEVMRAYMQLATAQHNGDELPVDAVEAQLTPAAITSQGRIGQTLLRRSLERLAMG
jgi:predicted ATPase/DNA-binding winged helix-turn-helix (wHTH) protein